LPPLFRIGIVPEEDSDAVVLGKIIGQEEERIERKEGSGNAEFVPPCARSLYASEEGVLSTVVDDA